MQDRLKSDTIDSIDDKLHWIRKLTDRLGEEDSPEKTVLSIKQPTEQKSHDVDLNSDTINKTTAKDSSLPVYNGENGSGGNDDLN